MTCDNCVEKIETYVKPIYIKKEEISRNNIVTMEKRKFQQKINRLRERDKQKREIAIAMSVGTRQLI